MRAAVSLPCLSITATCSQRRSQQRTFRKRSWATSATLPRRSSTWSQKYLVAAVPRRSTTSSLQYLVSRRSVRTTSLLASATLTLLILQEFLPTVPSRPAQYYNTSSPLLVHTCVCPLSPLAIPSLRLACLSPLHPPLIHPLQPPPIPRLHHLPLGFLLPVLEVPLVAQLNQVPGLVHLALEATDGGLDGLAVGDGHLDDGSAGAGEGSGVWGGG